MSAAPETRPEGACVVDFRRFGEQFCLSVDGEPFLTMDEDDARWLNTRIEAVLGSAFTRTRKPKKEPRP